MTAVRVASEQIYVEIERARLTRMLAEIREREGKIDEAAEILQELQVETFGSMAKREKTDFILEQMRLCLARHDFIRMQIISRKINVKVFTDGEDDDLKLKYYRLMIEMEQHHGAYLEVCKFYRAIEQISGVAKDPVESSETLKRVVAYLALAPYSNEQSDLMCRVKEEKRIADLPVFREVLSKFTTMEVTKWSDFTAALGSELRALDVFGATADGEKRWADLRRRLMEHSIRVIAKYYTRMHTVRLSELLDISGDETEEILSRLVESKTVVAKIDRLRGIVVFRLAQRPQATIDEWGRNIASLVSVIERSKHLITKEEMVHAVK